MLTETSESSEAVPSCDAFAAVVDPATGCPAPSDIATDRVQLIFSKLARHYRMFNALSSLGIYRSWLKTLATMADANGSTHLLDLAAGTGDVTFEICRRTPPSRVVCTDINKEMLGIAQERYARGDSHGVPCDFEIVDAQDLPYDDESFDLVTCAYGIRNIPDRTRAFKEVYRVLQPGGRYVILEFSTPPNALWCGLYGFYRAHIVPLIGRVLTGDRSMFDYLNSSIQSFPDSQSLALALEDVGFRRVTYKRRSGGIVTIHVAMR